LPRLYGCAFAVIASIRQVNWQGSFSAKYCFFKSQVYVHLHIATSGFLLLTLPTKVAPKKAAEYIAQSQVTKVKVTSAAWRIALPAKAGIWVAIAGSTTTHTRVAKLII